MPFVAAVFAQAPRDSAGQSVCAHLSLSHTYMFSARVHSHFTYTHTISVRTNSYFCVWVCVYVCVFVPHACISIAYTHTDTWTPVIVSTALPYRIVWSCFPLVIPTGTSLALFYFFGPRLNRLELQVQLSVPTVISVREWWWHKSDSNATLTIHALMTS